MAGQQYVITKIKYLKQSPLAICKTFTAGCNRNG